MAVHAVSEMDRCDVTSLLAALIAELDRAPRGESLRPLLRACDAAIESSLEMLRDAPAEPAAPTRHELASLLESLVTSDRCDTVAALRQLRRAIGRLDGSLR
jgi:hypothetical protein